MVKSLCLCILFLIFFCGISHNILPIIRHASSEAREASSPQGSEQRNTPKGKALSALFNILYMSSQMLIIGQ